jgi:uncharacterized protein involved in response to NO
MATTKGSATMAPPQTTSSDRRRAYDGPLIFAQGFRPFFLGAGVLAALALPLWMLQFLGVVALPGVPDPLTWHIHEMLFGYLGAALAGFLLTAMPNWTGRLPIAGGGLMALTALWLAGRAAMLADAQGPLGGAVAAAFPVVLAAVAWREVMAAGNRRNAPVCLMVSAFALAQIVFLFGSRDLGIRLGFSTAAMMILLIGGRIVPSFTGNWMKKQGEAALPAAFGTYDKATLALTLATLAAWCALPDHPVSGLAFALAAAANLWRLLRWRGGATFAEPLLAMLHVAYAWVPLAFALFALSILTPGLVAPAQALHALGAGAVGLMTLAVMTRASLGHSGRDLRADLATTAAYLLVLVGAPTRVAADWTGDPVLLLHLGATCWTAGFAVFVLRYAPILLIRRPPAKTS